MNYFSKFLFLRDLCDFPTESDLEAVPRGASGGMPDVSFGGCVRIDIFAHILN